MKFVALFSHTKNFFFVLPPKTINKNQVMFDCWKVGKNCNKKVENSSFLRGLSYCIQIPSFQLLWVFKYSRCRTKTSVTRHRVAVSPLKRICEAPAFYGLFIQRLYSPMGVWKVAASILVLTPALLTFVYHSNSLRGSSPPLRPFVRSLV